jgi:hypothetical protein
VAPLDFDHIFFPPKNLHWVLAVVAVKSEEVRLYDSSAMAPTTTSMLYPSVPGWKGPARMISKLESRDVPVSQTTQRLWLAISVLFVRLLSVTGPALPGGHDNYRSDQETGVTINGFAILWDRHGIMIPATLPSMRAKKASFRVLSDEVDHKTTYKV